MNKDTKLAYFPPYRPKPLLPWPDFIFIPLECLRLNGTIEKRTTDTPIEKPTVQRPFLKARERLSPEGLELSQFKEDRKRKREADDKEEKRSVSPL